MFALRRPSPEVIASVVAACEALLPNHPHVVTADLARPPPGFDRDEISAQLGKGEAMWARARSAIDSLAMYPTGWTRVYTSPGAPAMGAPLVSVIRHFGFYSVLPGRIREVLEDEGATRRHGFAFHTLAGHAECGVERFVVTWDTQSDVVHYELTAISSPAGWLRLGRPIARRLQRRFQRDSVISMQRATACTTR